MVVGGKHLTGKARERCSACAHRFTRLSFAVGIAMAAIKLAAGILTGSRALSASALYSINDSFSAVIAIVSLKMVGRPADEDHAYGHGKIEFLAVAGMAFTLGAGVCFVAYESMADIMRGVKAPPHLIAGAVAILVALSNWLLAKRGFCTARSLQSPTLHNSAEHSQADALSSVAVLIGVVGGALGFHSLDQYVAVFETVHVLALAGAMLGKSLNGFMDRALPAADALKIRNACEQVEGILRVAKLRTRMVGGYAVADIFVVVASTLTVDEADAICRRARDAVRGVLAVEVLTHIGFNPDDSLRGRDAGLDTADAHG